MVLFMARPFKHPKTGVYWFRKVVPASMRPLVRKVEERRSLRTKDPRQAALRFTEVAAKVAAEWEALRRGPVMADLARSFVQQLDPDGRAALAEDLLEVDLRAAGVLDERELPYDWEPGDRTPATQKAISRVLVSCPTNSFTYTFDLVEDLLACGGPGEGSCFRVVGFDEDLDLGDEVLRTDKGSAPDLALGYQSEPAFDLIEP